MALLDTKPKKRGNITHHPHGERGDPAWYWAYFPFYPYRAVPGEFPRGYTDSLEDAQAIIEFLAKYLPCA